MRKICILFLLAMGCFLASAQVQSEIFDQLQENVWYLKTSDGQAQLYLTSIGQGDTIVTLHGGPGNDFHYLVDALKGNADRNTFVLFDQRGSLLSPVNDSLTRELTLDVLVEDLETIRKSLHQEKMVLFGHSFGSILAMFYYKKYPQHVRGMILTATAPPYMDSEKPFSDILTEMRGRLNDLRSRPEVAEELGKAGLLNKTALTPKQQSDRFKITGLAAYNMYDLSKWRSFKGGQIYYNSSADDAIGNSLPETYDIRPQLNKFPVPITIIQGDKDYIDPSASYWTGVFSAYPFVKLSVVKDACHYIWLDRKGEFDSSMRAAMDRINSFEL